MSDSLVQQLVNKFGPDKVLESIPPERRNEFIYDWKCWARPEQQAPDGDWLLWLLLAGRGFGKSRTGAEWSREQAKQAPGSHGALIGPTAADVRDVMVKALLACTPPSEGLIYEPSKRLLSWANGSTATLYSAEEPDRLRGPQHHWAWVDELAAWQYADEVWDMLMMTMRLGSRPRVVASTTPRPIPLLRRLMWCHDHERSQHAPEDFCARCGRQYRERAQNPSTSVTRGSTFDNAANLSAAFIASIRDRYEGTRLGRQELFAEVLEEIEGALWNHAAIDALRVKAHPAFKRVVVAVDPSGSAKKTADEAGIVVCGLGVDGHGYVLEDLSGRYSPRDMAEKACAAYHRHNADRLVAEDNFGGQIVADLIHLTDRRVAFKAVHASRGKIVRAEPVAALYEQAKVHHVGMFAQLEDEMCHYAPLTSTESPGRMDALVWAFTDLMLYQATPVPRGVYRVSGSF